MQNKPARPKYLLAKDNSLPHFLLPHYVTFFVSPIQNINLYYHLFFQRLATTTLHAHLGNLNNNSGNDDNNCRYHHFSFPRKLDDRFYMREASSIFFDF